MPDYAWAHLAHLFFRRDFLSAVFFFEALVLSVMHTSAVSRESRREVERALSRRAVKVMPWVVAAVFLSGLTMAYLRYLPNLAAPFASSFNLQLTLKVIIAASILLHFVVAVTKNAAAHADQSLVALYPYRRAVAHDADCDTGENHVLFCVVTPVIHPNFRANSGGKYRSRLFPNG